MKLRKLLRALLILITAVVLIAAGGVGWLYTTESGARFVLGRVAAATGGALSYGGVSGRLKDTVNVSDIRYRDGAREIALDELGIGLDLLQLFSHRLAVETLVSSEISYRQLDAAAEMTGAGSALQGFKLPIAVQFSRTAIAGLTIERPGAAPIEIEKIVLSAAAAGTAAEIQRFEFWFRGFFISMQGRAGWENGLAVGGVVSWAGEAGESALLGNTQIEGRWPNFIFEQKTIEPIAQTARGSVNLASTPAFDLTIEQPDLGGATAIGTFDPATATWRASITADGLAPGAFIPGWPGKLNVDGDIAATAGTPWRFAADDLELAIILDDEVLRATLDGSLSGLDSAALDRLTISLGANRAELSGTIGADVDLELTAQFDDLDAIGAFISRDEIQRLAPMPAPIESLTESLTGQAALDLAISGQRRAPTVAGDLSLTGSQYAGMPLSLELSFASPTPGSDSILIQQLDASLGGSRVNGSGRVGSTILAADVVDRDQAALDLSLALTADDLSELAGLGVPVVEPDDVAGSGSARVRLTGSVGRPDLDAVADLAGLRYDRYELASAHLEGRLGLYAGATTELDLAARAPEWSLAMNAVGTLRDERWEGRINTLSADEPWLGTWRLESPVAVQLAPERVEIENACLVHAASEVCIDWLTGGSDDRINVTAEQFDLAVLAPVLPPTVSLSGVITLKAALGSPTGVPNGMLTASGTGIGIDISVSETDSVDTYVETIELDAALNQYAFEARAQAQSRAGGIAEIVMATTDVRDRNAAISGKLDMFWPDLASLSLLSPDVGEVGGALTMSLDVGGTVANPEPSGIATINGGQITIPQWGVLIDRIEAQAVSDAGSSLEYSGSGFVEDSEIRLSGVTEIDLAAGWPTRLRLTGDRIPIARRPDATVFASPDFDVEIDLPRIEVAGRVTIPAADISVDTLPAQAVKVSPDSVVHGQTEAEPIRPLEVVADVTVELGDAVHYTGLNLDTALSGMLRLRYQSGLTPEASGGLSLNGGYDAYGQRLELERGELLFAGPLDDPALDVLAVREIGTTRVGIRLNGTLRAPETSLYSDPPMSDLNALSYLRFGRPSTSIDGSETVTLESAALALGLQQALPAVQRVGDALGLDELSIEPTEVDAGSLMAGKNLSPKVYLSYSYGLFNRLGGFLLRYHINDRFSLETRSGSEKSMDFLYSVEKN